MVLLGFTVLKEELLSHKKCQTIRRPRKRAWKVGDHVELYWHSRQKDCTKLGDGIVTSIVRKKAIDFTEDDAIRDGFSDQGSRRALGFLYETLRKLHPKDDLQVYFDVITWRWK